MRPGERREIGKRMVRWRQVVGRVAVGELDKGDEGPRDVYEDNRESI